MTKKRLIAMAIAMLFATAANAGNGVTAEPTPVPAAAEQGKSAAAGDAATEQLLLLMDTDKDGTVSKQEFMAYMDAEFDRLDQNKDGKLDVKELTRLHLRTGSGVHR